ncbi:MAG: hypothetical protein QNI90_09075 [Dinoroseobacter sp.]|nr:hypothetical protein [Dinoroseobacter sp.]
MSLERSSLNRQSLVLIDSLTEDQQTAVRIVRLWHGGTDGKETVWTIFCRHLGMERARVALRALERGLRLIARNGTQKKLQLHPIGSELATPDERLLAELLDQTLCPDREEALLSAMLLVRPDLASHLLTHVTQLSLHLRCIALHTDTHSDGSSPRRLN